MYMCFLILYIYIWNSFLYKINQKEYKIMQLISNVLYKKTMFLFIQVHVHWMNLMKKSYENFKDLKFWTKGKEKVHFSTMWLVVYVH
jgi:hypothetical protein